MSELDSAPKSAEIAGHIAPTKNHTPLTITTIRLTFLQNYPFPVLQKVTRSHIRYLNRIPPPNRESLPRVGRHTLTSAPQKLAEKHSLAKFMQSNLANLIRLIAVQEYSYSKNQTNQYSLYQLLL